MELKELLFKNCFSPVITYIIIGLLGSLYAFLKHISWIEFYYSIPLSIKVFLLMLFFVWITIIFIRKKMEYNTPYAVGRPFNGWKNIKKIDHFNVKWQVRIPRPSPLNNYEVIKHDKIPSIDIDPIPKCPRCGTKLGISDNFLWYTWYCAKCGFKKRTWESVFKIQGDVQNIVEGEIEQEMEQYEQNH